MILFILRLSLHVCCGSIKLNLSPVQLLIKAYVRLFLATVIYPNEFAKKENKIWTRGKTELQLTVEPRYNKETRGWQNLFTITTFRYMEGLFHIFYYYCGKENCLLYRGLHYRGSLYRSSTVIFMFHFFGLWGIHPPGAGDGGGGGGEVVNILEQGHSMEEVGKSALLSLQSLTLVKTVIIHFATCLTARDLVFMSPIHFVFHGN